MTAVQRPSRPERSWTLLDLLDTAPGLTALSATLGDLADAGHPVVALTGDLKHSNGLVRFAERHPDRFFNMGIAEQNMVSVAAGMATLGLVPYVADFAAFLALLCCEQIRTDVACTRSCQFGSSVTTRGSPSASTEPRITPPRISRSPARSPG